MGKQRLNTTRHRARAARHEKDMRKAEQPEDTGFRYRHDESMRKMLKGVDVERYLRLAGGS